jgi:hypothetical protein
VLETRGIGVGVLLTLAVLAVLIVLCTVLLVPHGLVRGISRLLGIRRRPHAVKVVAPPAWRPFGAPRLPSPDSRRSGVDVHDEGPITDQHARLDGTHDQQPIA